MAQRSTLLPCTLALLTFATGACEQEGAGARFTDATPAPHRFLEANYPAEVSAGDVILTRELIARGDSLYHGATGRANCVICHGPLLTGGSEGTNLRDGKWHNGDGSNPFIISTIRTGVSKPDHLNMPPMGGTQLTREEIQAIAAYVYWFSNVREAAGDSLSL